MLAAEAKLKDLQDRVETLGNEKNDVTAELQNEADELNQKLKDANAMHDAFSAQKSEELNQLNLRIQRDTADHEAALKGKTAEINTLESRSRSDADKFSAQAKEKNETISDLGLKLQELSAKFAACLKKTAALEAQNTAYEREIAGLHRTLKKLEQHNAKLLKTVQNSKERPTTLD